MRTSGRLRALAQQLTRLHPGAPAGLTSAQLQQAAWHHALLARLAPNTGRPRSLATFQPSRLYPQQRGWTPEAVALWGIVGANVAGMLLAKSEVPEARAFTLTHLRTSVEALYHGRYHTLATAMFSHLSIVHAAINLGMLLMFRRVQQLQASELLWLYLLGGLAGGLGHAAYHWYDAGGSEYGPKYALNTPAYCGCSGSVAAIMAYKAFFAPGSLQLLLVVPVPLVAAAFIYTIMEVKEKEYSDGPPAKQAGVAFGMLAALFAWARRVRHPLWLGGQRSAAAAPQAPQQPL